MPLTPRIKTISDPVTSVTTVTNPIGIKNVAGTQINPATEDTALLVLAQFDITLSALAAAVNP